MNPAPTRQMRFTVLSIDLSVLSNETRVAMSSRPGLPVCPEKRPCHAAAVSQGQ
jgi:hypothetical protein